MSKDAVQSGTAGERDTASAMVCEVLDVLAGQGLRDIILSPGSRNTPLAIAIEARPELRCRVVSDERTAAFLAMGLSIASQRPVALACTSGTALYNYAPAVAEAFQQGIPLIVLTADRPRQWIGQDDSQTLEQPGALANIVKSHYDVDGENGMGTSTHNAAFPCERDWHVNRIANEAWIIANSPKRGPVHINLRLPDPLNATTKAAREEDKKRTRIIQQISGVKTLERQVWQKLAGEFVKSRVMVTAGFMPPDQATRRGFEKLLQMPNVVIMAEKLSNLHLNSEVGMIDSVLCRMDADEKQRLAPDIVISSGGALVSRMLKEFLRHSDTQHWTLGDASPAADCFQRLTSHIEMAPGRFFLELASHVHRIQKTRQDDGTSDYNHLWHEARIGALNANRSMIDSAPWSELKALDKLFHRVPKNWNLFFSNGTPVRYGEILDMKSRHAVFCNRGVSGIEGGNATALGIATVYKGTTLLITGDMSFSYDTHILGLTENSDLRIVFINNSGGGIFRFIRTTRDLPERERLFCADPHLPCKGLAEAYGWNYHFADSEQSLDTGLHRLLQNPRTLLEIKVDPGNSSKTLIKFLN